MAKYLIYTDPHFCKQSSILRKRGEKYSVRLTNLIESISWVEHLAEAENCDEVICCGDFFDRPDIDAEEITALQEVYFSNIPHTIITGNHDSNVASLDFSSVKVFKRMNSNIVTDTQVKEVNGVEVYYIPYIAGHEHLYLHEFVNKNDKKKIILTHNDLAGIRYGKFKSETGFDVKDILDSCTVFINGHLHNGYIINDRIILVGNLTGLNFNEDANKYDHYAYILTISDSGQIDIEPRVNPHALNFYKLYINSTAELNKLNNLKCNAVVSVICEASLIAQVEEKLTKLPNILEFKLTANYSKFEDDEGTLDLSVEDHLKQFINYVQTKIENTQILSEELALLGSRDEYKISKNTTA